jgi:hypothetical protein
MIQGGPELVIPEFQQSKPETVAHDLEKTPHSLKYMASKIGRKCGMDKRKNSMVNA